MSAVGGRRVSATPIRAARAAILSGVLAATAVGGPAAAQVPVPNYTQLLQVPMRSLTELRFEGVVQQTRDLSCGAAALATLLTYFYEEPVSEGEVIEAGFEVGDAERIRRDGFSMLELKRIGERRGYVVEGYRLPAVATLRNLRVPAITLISTRGYEHFVVIKGVRGDEVFIADPAFGNRAHRLEEFAEEWRNVILVVLSATKEGRAAFTSDPSVKAPVRDVIPLLDRTLVTMTPAPNQF